MGFQFSWGIQIKQLPQIHFILDAKFGVDPVHISDILFVFS